jgi:NADH dehydrogenase (ubiquinone) 1 alpha subcomplex subunit 13
MPPVAGFGTVQYKRALPFKGPSGAVIFAVVGAIMGVGWYRTIGGRREKHELAREERWSRVYQLPFLVAENDRDAYRRQAAAKAREAIIMKDVPGWEVRSPRESRPSEDARLLRTPPPPIHWLSKAPND